MFILDTNVVSELMRASPNPAVAAWVQKQSIFNLATTTITLAEIQRGLQRLPVGRRRKQLESNFATFVDTGFDRRVFAFDEIAAQSYANVCTMREKKGLGIDPVDMMIAAIAHSSGTTLATRNISDFEECGVRLFNPWVD